LTDFVCLNSLAKVLNDNIEGSLYVDDFLICYRGKNMNNIERQLQLCLNKIEQWAMENGYKFSSSKTLGMFSREGSFASTYKLSTGYVLKAPSESRSPW
jgi:hypothetical protein